MQTNMSALKLPRIYLCRNRVGFGIIESKANVRSRDEEEEAGGEKGGREGKGVKRTQEKFRGRSSDRIDRFRSARNSSSFSLN